MGGAHPARSGGAGTGGTDVAGRVAVVTDSTADLPPWLVEERALRVVPMSVAFDSDLLVSGVTISVEEFYRRLEEAVTLPTTSQPAPAWFQEAYAECDDAGATAVVSIHLSSTLSGTVDLARQMAAEAPLPVTVVDSSQVSGGLGLMVLAAERRAVEGADVGEVVEVAERVREGLSSAVVVETLEYLRKGGRLSGTQALIGTVLKVKPVLGLVDGRLEVLSRSRTWRRAREHLVERARDHLAGRPARVAITHALAPERARELLGRLREEVAVQDSLTTTIGPVIGTHTGPGAVALAVCPAAAG